jgi:thioesterase domain-containing protein
LPIPDTDAYAIRGYEEPQGETEVLLAEVFAEVLNLQRIGRHDNFFEIGGHSLSAVRLVTLLEHKDIHLSLADIFTNQTVAALASCCSTHVLESSTESPILLRKGTRERSVFLVHDGMGEILYAQMLSRQSDSRLTLYGLPAEEGEPNSLTTVEQLAERLVRILRDFQPSGPYSLAGWSFGGLLAYEMALQLTKVGESVNFLGLFDTTCARTIYPSQGNTRVDLDDQALLFAYLRDLGLHENRDDQSLAALFTLSKEMDFESLVQHCKNTSLLSGYFLHKSAAQIRIQLRRQQTYFTASSNYIARPVGVPLHLFRARESGKFGSALGPSLGWSSILAADQLRITIVPGNHHSMLRSPNIGMLAREFSQSLLGE